MSLRKPGRTGPLHKTNRLNALGSRAIFLEGIHDVFLENAAPTEVVTLLNEKEKKAMKLGRKAGIVDYVSFRKRNHGKI
jgi:hypothetical protein